MISVLESLNKALNNAMAVDPRVVMIGEDILSPYGGAFKVTRGLSDAYPGRVVSTPVSEAGILGISVGMALRGLLPVVEIMFGDFITLAADQLINHAAKFRWMYNNQVNVPMVVRVPMGGRRGYGPTHSQTLEKIFLGVPGLRILAPTTLGDPGLLLRTAILEDPDPVIFIENKLQYPSSLIEADSSSDFELVSHPPSNGELGSSWESCLEVAEYATSYTVRIRSAPPPSLTLVSYGYMVDLAMEAMLKLAYQHEIFTELLAVTQLAPFHLDVVRLSAAQTRRALIVEEGTLSMGWGAEVAARLAESTGPEYHAIKRLASADLPIAASRSIEAAQFPGVTDIVQAAVSMV